MGLNLNSGSFINSTQRKSNVNTIVNLCSGFGLSPFVPAERPVHRLLLLKTAALCEVMIVI